MKMLYEASQSLGKMAVHLEVQISPGPKEMTVMDYAFKVNVLAGNVEREVVPPSTTTTTTMAASTSPAPAPTLTPTPTVGLLRRQLPLLS
jgi:biotin synthase-related radical SAM superfamily protein